MKAKIKPLIDYTYARIHLECGNLVSNEYALRYRKTRYTQTGIFGLLALFCILFDTPVLV